MGLTTSTGKDVGHIGIDLDTLPPFEEGAINLHAWFDKERQNLPLDLEIGSGKGTFLVKQATAVPDVNYIGLEYARAYWRHAADRLRRHGIQNVRMLPGEAGFFIRNYVPHQSLTQVHIYFPDPWPKARHNKRRLVQAPFLELLHAKLKKPAPGVQICLATDHLDYFHWMEDHASQVAHLFERLPFQSPKAAAQGEMVGTNFEAKYRQEGRTFNGMILKKK